MLGDFNEAMWKHEHLSSTKIKRKINGKFP
jgi:hypothetical protein